jgi:hypothetical protein
MGAASSLEIPGGGTDGYQVIKVQDNSPGLAAGLEAFFDFIVAVNGNRLVALLVFVVLILQSVDDETLKNACAAHIDKPMKILVYSSRDQSVRGFFRGSPVFDF